MAKFPSVLRLSLFTVWTVIMTSLTYVLGAPCLKVLRRRVGRAPYWALSALISAGLFFVRIDTGQPGGALDCKVLAVAFFSQAVLLGVFDEFEEMGFSFIAASFFTLLLNTLLAAGAFALWVFHTGPNWSQIVLAAVESALKPVTELNPHLQVNVADLILQLPSVLIILWMFGLYISVLLENKLSVGDLAVEPKVPSLRPQLATFKLPDACVWIFIGSLLGAFVEMHMRPVEAVSVNAMNICLVLFFFQGIAVVSKFFERVRLGTFWQVLFMILIVVQLFLFVSLLGLLDFWLDFRQRLAKRTEEFNRET